MFRLKIITHRLQPTATHTDLSRAAGPDSSQPTLLYVKEGAPIMAH